MAKQKKSFIRRLFSFLFGCILTVVLIVAGICVYVKIKYEISIISAISQIKILNEEVDENEYFENKYNDGDKLSIKNKINSEIPNLITFSQESGYKISNSISNISDNFLLLISEKQIGALMQIMIDSQQNLQSIKIGEAELPIQLIQVNIDNVDTIKKETEFSLVVKLDISLLKTSSLLTKFEFITKYIPKTLYFNSTVKIIKDGDFNYSISSYKLMVNKLSGAESKNLLKMINLLTNLGEPETLNLQIATPYVNLLIGNEGCNGFTYMLKNSGVTAFDFSTIADKNYYVITKN